MEQMLVLTNGRIYTQDRRRPTASWLAIDGERILALGDQGRDHGLLAGEATVVDLGGRCVIPGLVDAHIHFEGYALGLRQLALQDVTSLDEALVRVGRRASELEAGEWLQGGRWNQADWLQQSFPTAQDLDRVAGHLPVFLVHRSGHAAWVNGRALEAAGIGPDTADPPGGQIQRDEQGRPTGMLFEEAVKLVAQRIPRLTDDQVAVAMRQAQSRLLRAGLTGFHDFDGPRCFRILQSLRLEGQLELRAVKNIRLKELDDALRLGLRSGFGDDWLRIGAVKMFADGALGPRTAAMLTPYEGEPGNRGMTVVDQNELLARARQASAKGLSVAVHAIGDRANRTVLDVYQALRAEEFGQTSLDKPIDVVKLPAGKRHRIEHAQLVDPDDFERFAGLGIIASMQPIHATSDMDMASRYWGERAASSYAWRTMIDSGAILAFGSDAPVEPHEPLLGIHAAVTRRRENGYPGNEGWYPSQRLTMAEAIQAYTWGAAVAAGREAQMGAIAPGRLADLTILDRDIYGIPDDELLETHVAGTVVGGRFGYKAW